MCIVCMALITADVLRARPQDSSVSVGAREHLSIYRFSNMRPVAYHLLITITIYGDRLTTAGATCIERFELYPAVKNHHLLMELIFCRFKI